MRRKKSEPYILAPDPEVLAQQFMGEVIASIAGCKKSSAALDALRRYFWTLPPHVRVDDFMSVPPLPVPEELHLIVDGWMLRGHFGAWLRKRGIDPDTIVPWSTRSRL
jgi:hypothetical protein